MDNNIPKKKNNSFLALRIYANKLGLDCIKYKEVSKGGKEYTHYKIIDNKGLVVIKDRYPKVIREKLELIEKYSINQ